MRVFQLQRLSALGLIVFLTIHMIVTHYPPFHIEYSIIAERMSRPIWKAIDIALLFFVLIHALAGTYAVLIDSQKIATYKRALAGIAIVVGILAFIYGTQTILAFQSPY